MPNCKLARVAANNGQPQPTLQQKQKQCAGIYQDYENEINRQAWKNVATVAVAAGGASLGGAASTGGVAFGIGLAADAIWNTASYIYRDTTTVVNPARARFNQRTAQCK